MNINIYNIKIKCQILHPLNSANHLVVVELDVWGNIEYCIQGLVCKWDFNYAPLIFSYVFSSLSGRTTYRGRVKRIFLFEIRDLSVSQNIRTPTVEITPRPSFRQSYRSASWIALGEGPLMLNKVSRQN